MSSSCVNSDLYLSYPQACEALVDSPKNIGQLDADTAISHHTYLAAIKAAGAVCAGVDRVMAGKVREGI